MPATISNDIAKFIALRNNAIANAIGTITPRFVFNGRVYFCEQEPLNGEMTWGTKWA